MRKFFGRPTPKSLRNIRASVLFLMFFVLHLIWKMEEELLVI